MTVTLRDLRVMDVPGPDGSRAPAIVDDVVRRAQLGQMAAPASLLALAAWQSGHGVMQARAAAVGSDSGVAEAARVLA